MKPGLKRIEATLDQLTTAEGLTDSALEQHQPAHRSDPAATAEGRSKSSSKAIQPFPLPKVSQVPLVTSDSASRPAEPTTPPTAPPSKAQIVLPATRTTGKSTTSKKAVPARSQSAKPSSAETLPLPKSKPPSFSSHRHAVNPDLAIGLLKEVETVVRRWQLDLEQTVLEIQALYLEGPIVDGWLESHPVGSPQVMQPIGTATLRHAEIDRLMDYVEEICRMPQTLDPNEAPRTGYRLCGLDADGTLWSRPCPAEQVPYVGLAIARYQKLRILLARKQGLENRLNQLIQTLTFLHGQMQEG